MVPCASCSRAIFSHGAGGKDALRERPTALLVESARLLGQARAQVRVQIPCPAALEGMCWHWLAWRLLPLVIFASSYIIVTVVHFMYCICTQVKVPLLVHTRITNETALMGMY